MNIRLEERSYYTRYVKGDYNGVKFLISDVNGDIYVKFENYVETDSGTFNKMITEIEQYYRDYDLKK